ncbi:MAG TPA: outer membrane beta-barrel protein [Balneolales bacterium]|nr:outer membrane beta-barrel protein [Balneolales bacterium]
MKRLVWLLLILFATFFVHFSVNAQSFKGDSWSIELGSGVPFASFNEANQMEPVYSISLNYDINPVFSIRSGFNKGVFKNVNKLNWFGRTFTNHYLSFGIKPQINFVKIFDVNNRLERLNVYGISGLGVLHNDVKAALNPQMATDPSHLNGKIIDQFKGINNKTNALYYSLGLGISYYLTNRIGLFARYEYNLTNSDYVDGYTTAHAQVVGPNNYSNDNYSLLTTGISIRIGGHGRSYATSSSDDYTSASVLAKSDSLLLHKLAALIQQNGKAIQKTNDQLYTTNLIFRNFVNKSSSNQPLVDNAKIKNLQAQIDSLKSMRTQVDYLNSKIDKKIAQSNSNNKLPKYFIIADAFLELSKAKNLLKQLQNIGYSDARVINDNTNVWYLVAYAEIGNEKEAGEILKKIRAYQNPSAWIYANN